VPGRPTDREACRRSPRPAGRPACGAAVACPQVFKVCGRESLIDIAIALETAALNDPYFVERKLYPNVDFYSGLIYKGAWRADPA